MTGHSLAVRRFACCLLAVLLLAPIAAAQEAPQVRPADLSRLSPADFADEELYVPYYLAHFHRLANSVRTSGPDRGFIDLSVWRRPQDNRPYNARIMENLLSLAFFYATDRPWNPYHGDPALRTRLEAALDFWVRRQNPDGRFSEYGEENWSLAPTAFATKFMGETLRLLKSGPPVDPGLLRRVAEADRKAILAGLSRPDMYRHGVRFSNQYTNLWPGALAYLALYPDAEIERRLRERMRQSVADFQSPNGFFYEEHGPDFGYNLGTHHSNVHMAWHHARGTELGRMLVEETERWYDWFSYNAVPEPDGSGFTVNRGIETRQQAPFVSDNGQDVSGVGFPLAEQVELARILGATREEHARQLAERRAELERTWPRVDSLPVGEFSAFSPYAFLHRPHAQWRPTDAQRREAMVRLPYVARERFVHQRTDSRKPVTFTYVRRPAYYAAFNAGELWREQQRYGLGLLWVPGAGSFLQSQSGTDRLAWGTRADGAPQVYEAATFVPSYRAGGAAVQPQPGNRDLPDGDLVVSYPLGEAGRKTVDFQDGAIRVTVEHPGRFTEQLPLLMLPSDQLLSDTGRVELRRGDTRVLVSFDPATRPVIERTETFSGKRRVMAISLPAEQRLSYVVEVQRSASTETARQPVYSELWGRDGERWSPRGRLPDFSRAGYRRGEAELPTPPVTHNVRDFGAVGDGRTDDSEAFERAIRAVDRGVLLIPRGRYVLSRILEIDKPNLVLRGEDRDGTVLFFPRPLNDIKPDWSATTEGRPTSNYSWAGGFFWWRGSYQTEKLSDVVQPAGRGDHLLRLASTRGLRVGQEVEIRQQDTQQNSLALHLYSDDAGETAKLLGRTHASLVARITAIDGDRITVDRPLRFDVRAEWKPAVYRFDPTVREVGIENLTFEFPVTPYEGHFTELGFNPIAFDDVADCWVRDIRMVNADSGPFVGARFCTLTGLVYESQRRPDPDRQSTCHHGVYLQDDDNLYTRFDFRTECQHDISVSHNAGNVISSGRGVDLSLDHHKRAPYENLFTDIDAGEGTHLWRSGGGSELGKHTGARATFWNIRTRRPQWHPGERFGPWSMNVVGLTTQAATLTYQDGVWFEAVPPERLHPQNLHEAQRAKRSQSAVPAGTQR